jgi:hypothetical protein
MTPRPRKDSSGWVVVVAWPDGKEEQINEFRSLSDVLRQDGQISESVRQEAEPPDAGFQDYKAGLRPGELKHLIGGIS